MSDPSSPPIAHEWTLGSTPRIQRVIPPEFRNKPRQACRDGCGKPSSSEAVPVLYRAWTMSGPCPYQGLSRSGHDFNHYQKTGPAWRATSPWSPSR